MNHYITDEIVFDTLTNIIFDIQTMANSETKLNFRANFVDDIKQFKNVCLSFYGERVTDFLYFALIVCADEIAFQGTEILDKNLLQEELLNRNDGDCEFFKICADIIKDPTFPLILYKTLYLIIMIGFQGIYRGDDNYLDQIKQKLRSVIKEKNRWSNRMPTA